jgi:hypothetical protein
MLRMRKPFADDRFLLQWGPSHLVTGVRLPQNLQLRKKK